MLSIVWKLAPEGASQDCFVGAVTIAGDGLKIEKDGVCVDAWPAASIRVLDVEGDSTVDIPKSLDAMAVSPDGHRIALSFREERVIGSRESFKTALRSSLCDILNATKLLPDRGFANPLRPVLASFARVEVGDTENHARNSHQQRDTVR